MATFIEVRSLGDKRVYLRASSIDRIVAPAGLDPNESATPEKPLLFCMKDGSTIPSFGQTVIEIMIAMMHHTGHCALVDPPND